MDTKKFNKLLRTSRNGGRYAIGGAASELHALFRKMVVGFLRKKPVLITPAMIDDLVGSLFIRLLEIKKIPEGRTWNTWFWYTMKSVWVQYCKDYLSEEVSLDSPEAQKSRTRSLPVPIEANARLNQKAGKEFLKKKVLALTERFPEEEKLVWKRTVNKLLNYGTIQSEKNASVWSGLSREECRQIIVRAVVRTRIIFEELFGGPDAHTIEECETGRELAERIF